MGEFEVYFEAYVPYDLLRRLACVSFSFQFPTLGGYDLGLVYDVDRRLDWVGLLASGALMACSE